MANLPDYDVELAKLDEREALRLQREIINQNCIRDNIPLEYNQVEIDAEREIDEVKRTEVQREMKHLEVEQEALSGKDPKLTQLYDLYRTGSLASKVHMLPEVLEHLKTLPPQAQEMISSRVELLEMVTQETELAAHCSESMMEMLQSNPQLATMVQANLATTMATQAPIALAMTI